MILASKIIGGSRAVKDATRANATPLEAFPTGNVKVMQIRIQNFTFQMSIFILVVTHLTVPASADPVLVVEDVTSVKRIIGVIQISNAIRANAIRLVRRANSATARQAIAYVTKESAVKNAINAIAVIRGMHLSAVLVENVSTIGIQYWMV